MSRRGSLAGRVGQASVMDCRDRRLREVGGFADHVEHRSHLGRVLVDAAGQPAEGVGGDDAVPVDPPSERFRRAGREQIELRVDRDVDQASEALAIFTDGAGDVTPRPVLDATTAHLEVEVHPWALLHAVDAPERERPAAMHVPHREQHVRLAGRPGADEDVDGAGGDAQGGDGALHDRVDDEEIVEAQEAIAVVGALDELRLVLRVLRKVTGARAVGEIGEPSRAAPLPRSRLRVATLTAFAALLLRSRSSTGPRLPEVPRRRSRDRRLPFSVVAELATFAGGAVSSSAKASSISTRRRCRRARSRWSSARRLREGLRHVRSQRPPTRRGGLVLQSGGDPILEKHPVRAAESGACGRARERRRRQVEHPPNGLDPVAVESTAAAAPGRHRRAPRTCRGHVLAARRGWLRRRRRRRERSPECGSSFRTDDICA